MYTFKKEQIYDMLPNQRDVTTGLEAVDNATGGYMKKELTVVASRVGFGKTSFVLNGVVERLKNKEGVLYFSLDFSAQELIERLITITVKFPVTDKFRDTLHDFSSFSTSSDRFDAKLDDFTAMLENLTVDDTRYIDISYIQNKSRECAKRDSIKMIVIDYYQHIENETNATLAKELRQLAEELDVSIILLSQLDHELENRVNKIPGLKDLEDKQLEIHAKTILMLYSEDYYTQEIDDIAEANAKLVNEGFRGLHIEKRDIPIKVIVAKSPYGKSRVTLGFAKESGYFFKFEMHIPNEEKLRDQFAAALRGDEGDNLF